MQRVAQLGGFLGRALARTAGGMGDRLGLLAQRTALLGQGNLDLAFILA